MTTDAALLALIVDDDDAIQVLAAWGALGPSLIQVDAAETTAALAELSGVGQVRVIRILRKLRASRVLVDGGISELADKMLQTRVQLRLRGARRERGKR